MAHPDVDGDALLTRRRLVQVGGVAAAGLVLGGVAGTGAATARTASAAFPAYLRRSSYARLKGAAFTATGTGGAKVTLRLAKVADLPRAGVDKRLAGSDDAFTLTLTGPRDAPLSGATHELRQASLGAFSLFLAPVGRPSGTQQRYEVVVDRSTTARG